MTTHKIAVLADRIAADSASWLTTPLDAIGYWHDDLGTIARSLRVITLTPEDHSRRAINQHHIANRLAAIAGWATALLMQLDVDNPAQAFVAEHERAYAEHPGMTLDDGPTDENRFYALSEKVGEAAASLICDNAKGTSHGADTITEVVQVGALALAWLVRYKEESSNA
nr:MAG TPA: hypothetical protein [Siphoviridae sp. ctvS314]